MTDYRQQTIFDLAAGRQARDEGIALVERHKKEGVEWAKELILKVAANGRPFTPDDVWAQVSWGCDPCVMSSAFSILARRRMIVKTGAFTQSKRPNQHATAIFFWRLA